MSETEIKQKCLLTFFHLSSLPEQPLPAGIGSVVRSILAPYLLAIESSDFTDQSDPNTGLLYQMMDRAHSTAVGVLTLVVQKQYCEAEALARTLYESSVQTHYILNKNTSERLVRYFVKYVEEEKRQNLRWREEVEQSTDPSIKFHLNVIDKKDEGLENYLFFIERFADHKNVQFDKIKKLPDTLDQLAELGNSLSYRTTYAAMCSQTHHDAEDILNSFLVCSTGGEAESVSNEKNTFAIHSILLATLQFVECLLAFGRLFQLEPMIREAKKSKNTLFQEAQIIGPLIGQAELPKRWLE